MGKLNITVTGTQELNRKLRQIGSAQPEMIENALRIAVLPFETRWKELVPVKTGTYRRSIHTEVVSRSATGASVMVGTDLTNPPYPLFLEQGTRRMAAHPSARPAWDETKGSIEAEFQRAYQAQLRARGIR